MSIEMKKFNKVNLLLNVLIVAILIAFFFLINQNNAALLVGNFKNSPIYSVNTNENLVAMEFNVAQNTDCVESILKILDERDVKATFFIIGLWGEKNPETLKKIQEAGHEIGNHGMNHAHHSGMTKEQNINEIVKAENIICEATGEKTVLFAPPYGEYDDTTVIAAQSLGYETIMWSVDTIDWRGDSVDTIINRVQSNTVPGSMILMHPMPNTVKALPHILDFFEENNLEPVTVGELIK